jgi:lysophospholipase L1-like esterase
MLSRLFAIPLAGLLVGAGALAFQRYELHRALRPLAPTIAFLGDSHTANQDWDLLLGCHDTANYGVGGETSAKIMVRLEQVIAAKPRFVIVMAGTNDAIENVRQYRNHQA